MCWANDLVWCSAWILYPSFWCSNTGFPHLSSVAGTHCLTDEELLVADCYIDCFSVARISTAPWAGSWLPQLTLQLLRNPILWSGYPKLYWQQPLSYGRSQRIRKQGTDKIESNNGRKRKGRRNKEIKRVTGGLMEGCEEQQGRPWRLWLDEEFWESCQIFRTENTPHFSETLPH